MKNKLCRNFTLFGLLVMVILASSCSSSDSSASDMPVEFSGCNFSGATVAFVEFFDGSTKVAYGYANLVGGAATVTMRDVHTDAVWLPTLNVEYSVYAYCFAGSVGDPVPTNHWATDEISYEQYVESEYAGIDVEGLYFHEVP
jgi:hypothetical protein